jgi:hypothetical protein
MVVEDPDAAECCAVAATGKLLNTAIRLSLSPKHLRIIGFLQIIFFCLGGVAVGLEI